MIEADIDHGNIVKYSEGLGYDYKNLWAVRLGIRKLPLSPSLILCKRFGIDTDEAIKIFQSQIIEEKTAVASTRKKKSSLLDRKKPTS